MRKILFDQCVPSIRHYELTSHPGIREEPFRFRLYVEGRTLSWRRPWSIPSSHIILWHHRIYCLCVKRPFNMEFMALLRRYQCSQEQRASSSSKQCLPRVHAVPVMTIATASYQLKQLRDQLKVIHVLALWSISLAYQWNNRFGVTVILTSIKAEGFRHNRRISWSNQRKKFSNKSYFPQSEPWVLHPLIHF